MMEVAAATEPRTDVGTNVGGNVGVKAGHPKKSICEELKASTKMRAAPVKKAMPTNREEVV